MLSGIFMYLSDKRRPSHTTLSLAKISNIIQGGFGRNLQINAFDPACGNIGLDVIKAERRRKTFAVAHRIVDMNIDAVFVAISRLGAIPTYPAP